jgi:hypothetical protein
MVTALTAAIKEVRKSEDLRRPYELDAGVTPAGEWLFTFSFLNGAWGAEVIATVGTNGVHVGPLF